MPRSFGTIVIPPYRIGSVNPLSSRGTEIHAGQVTLLTLRSKDIPRNLGDMLHCAAVRGIRVFEELFQKGTQQQDKV